MTNHVLTDDALTVSFLAYFKTSRLLKIGLAFNIFYYFTVVAGYLALLFSGELSSTIYTLDFQVFYEAGNAVVVSPNDLYNVSPNGLPYRYLPAFALIFALLYPLPLEVLYLTNISLMMLTNFAVLWMAYRACLVYGITSLTKNFEITLFIIFITPQHIVNLILGQVSQVAILLILTAVVVLQKADMHSLKQYILVGLLLGTASNLKPIFLLLCVFAIPIARSSWRSFSIPRVPPLGVFGGFSFAMLPNVIFFWMYPQSLDGFIRVNFIEHLDYHHSTSITRLLIDLIPSLQSEMIRHFIIALLSLIILSMSYRRFINTPNSSKKYITHFSEMIFLIVLVYPDSWFLFLAILYSVLGPSILMLYKSLPASSSKEKWLDFIWSGSNNLVAFFWIGVVLYYLVLGFDPLVPIWLLVLYLLFLLSLSQKHLEDGSNGIEPTQLQSPSTSSVG